MILGITGGVGAGKSTVMQYLKETYQAVIIECDAVGKEVQQPGGVCFPALCALLGPYGCVKDGVLDRAAMAKILFEDPDLLEQVNAIVHPAVYEEVQKRIREAQGEQGSSGSDEPLIVIESAILIQAGYENICDILWYVYADPQTRRERLKASRGYSDERIDRMMEAQPEDSFYRSHVHLTIDNSSQNVQNTYGQIDRGLKHYGILQHCQREQR